MVVGSQVLGFLATQTTFHGAEGQGAEVENLAIGLDRHSVEDGTFDSGELEQSSWE